MVIVYGDHYHLLIEPPEANLGRIMRHINGVYTQRHNRMKKTDGSLFRGRYKAILVDADNYLLQLSRYIHRNPIEGKRPIVEDLGHGRVTPRMFAIRQRHSGCKERKSTVC